MWTEKVSPLLLTRWRILQESGKEQGLAESLGIVPNNLRDSVPLSDRQFLAVAIARKCLGTLQGTVKFSTRKRECRRPFISHEIQCKPKVCCSFFLPPPFEDSDQTVAMVTRVAV